MTRTTNQFVLNFNTNIGRVLRITVPHARMDKVAANVQSSMEAIITNGAVVSASQGIPASIKSASTITTERRTVE